VATSTVASVRTVIVNAIKGIAQTDLGFAEANGNVREYPLEAHHEEDLPNYMTAKVGNARVVRCWAVDVRGHDIPYALQLRQRRIYTIRIYAYYAKGVGGVSYLDLLNHAQSVSGAIRSLSNNLGGTVNRITSSTPLDIVERTGLSVGKIWQGLMTYEAERENPDYSD